MEINYLNLQESSNILLKLGYVKEEVQLTFNYSRATEHWIYIAVNFLDAYFEGIKDSVMFEK